MVEWRIYWQIASLYCNPPSSVIICLRVHCRWSLIYDSQTFPIALYLYEPRGSGKGSCSVALRLQTKFCTLFSVGEDFVANYTTDWFQIGKGVCQDCILSPCLFNFYAEFIMLNARLESILMGKISISSDMQMAPHLWQKVKRD